MLSICSTLQYNISNFFFSSRRRHTRWPRDWSSDVCSSDLAAELFAELLAEEGLEVSGEITSGEAPDSAAVAERSEERRVGKECRSGWAPERKKKKTENDSS